MDHLDRNTKFTNKEFKALDRTSIGDIVDLSTAFIWITEEQKIELLSDDDYSRLHDYESEVNSLMAEFI